MLALQLSTIWILSEPQKCAVNYLHEHPAFNDAAHLFLEVLQINIWCKILQIAKTCINILLAEILGVFLKFLYTLA